MTISNRGRRTPPAWFFPAITLVLLLGAALRVLHIGDQAFWVDEGATYAVIRNPDIPSMLNFLSERDAHPPLYFVLLKGWSLLTGDSVVALRLFSALCSLLSVALVVPLARAIQRRANMRSASVPVLAALILALSDPEFVLAQDTRMHALRTLLVIVSALCYLRWLENGSRKIAAAWVIVNALLMHTHIQGVYILMAEGLHALIFLRKRQRLTALGLLIVSGLLYVPWFVGFGLNQLDYDHGILSSLRSNWGTLLILGQKYLSQMWPLMLGLLLAGSWLLLKRGQDRNRAQDMTVFLWAWVLITLVVSFVGNLWIPILAPHRILLISPALAVLTALGLRAFERPTRLFLAAVIVVYGVTTVDDYYPKEPWDAVAANTARYAEADDIALLEVYRGDYPLMYHIDQQLTFDLPVESLRVWREFQADQNYPQAVIDQLAAHDSVWLTHWSPDQSAFDFLAQTGHVQTAHLTTEHVGNLINVYRYDRPPEGEITRFTSGMILRDVFVSAEDGRVDLWWSADAPLTVDYSVSVFLLDSTGQLVAQHDAFPFDNTRPTTGWQAGEVVYDPHFLPVSGLAAGTYSVHVQVYTYFDGARFPTADGQEWATVATLER